jgi:hypothetical protein
VGGIMLKSFVLIKSPEQKDKQAERQEDRNMKALPPSLITSTFCSASFNLYL